MSYIGPKPPVLVLEPIDPDTIPIPEAIGISTVPSPKKLINLLNFEKRYDSDGLFHLRNAAQYFDRQAWKSAVYSYSAAQALNPQEPLIYLFRGVAHFRDKNIDEAIQDYTRAIHHFSTTNFQALAYYSRSMAWSEKRNWNAALLDMNQAHRRDPNNTYFLLGRIVIWRHLDIQENALKDASTILKIDFRQALPLTKLLAPFYGSRWYENTERQEKGKQIFAELAGFDLGTLESYFVVASLLYEQGHPLLASKILTPAINLFYRSKANFSKPTRQFLTDLLDHLPPPLRNHPTFLDFLKAGSLGGQQNGKRLRNKPSILNLRMRDF